MQRKLGKGETHGCTQAAQSILSGTSNQLACHSGEHVRPKSAMSKVSPWLHSSYLSKIPGVGLL